MFQATDDRAMVPSALRAIPMRARPDLVVERIDYQGQRSFVIKDPVGLKYHRLRPEQYRVLQLLDGQRNLEAIRDVLRDDFPAMHLALTDVQALVAELHKGGLVYTDRPGQGAAMLGKRRVERRKKIAQTLKSLLFLRLPGWDPEAVLVALLPFVNWLFRPWAVTLTWVFVAASWLALAANLGDFSRELPAFRQFFGWPNLLYMWITLAGCKILHEFGHGLSCKHYGSECHEMGMMLLVFSPCLYCDVTDSWMLRSKWKRFAIGAAGMYVEVFISAIAIWVWLLSGPGLTRMLALNVFFVTTITTVIFNANPLMRFDGYYMMADFLEIPNLRQKADKLLREKFGWHCLGIEAKPDPFMPETGTLWFAVFAIASWFYRWFILFGITMFLYQVLKPYGLQSIGATAAVASIGTALFAVGQSLYKQLTAPRVEPLDKWKVAATLVGTAGILALAWTIPLPIHVYAPFLAEPADARRVYVTAPGELTDVRVRPGQQVAADEIVAVLSDPELEDELRRLQADRRTEVERAAAFRAAADEARHSLALERLAGLDRQIADAEERTRHLTLRAPVAGVVVAATAKRPPSRDEARSRLSGWSGTPLDPENHGAFLEPGTELLAVAPADKADRLEATLLIDQTDRNDVFEGQAVELRFDHYPTRVFDTQVAEFSRRHVEYAPPPLSNKYGGPLATVSQPDGKEKLAGNAYQATALLDLDAALFRPGMRGQARLAAADRSAGQWLWRWIRRTFHFRM